MTVIGVLGAGSWGTTLADLLARKGHSVRLWAYEQEVVEAINARHENPVFLPGCALDQSLSATQDAWRRSAMPRWSSPWPRAMSFGGWWSWPARASPRARSW